MNFNDGAGDRIHLEIAILGDEFHCNHTTDEECQQQEH